MAIRALPRTTLGWWGAGLVAAFILFFVGGELLVPH